MRAALSNMRPEVIPPHRAGLRVGLFGGSFNPPHAAHRGVSLMAMKRLRLDQVWWLVTPGNPLKDVRVLPPLSSRLAAARKVAQHPRIRVTGIEAAFKTPYTADTLAILRRRCPEVHFVWIMGADNLPQFYRWKRWRQIFETVPVAVIDRGGIGPGALAARTAQALAAARLPEAAAPTLADRRPPAWIYLHGLKSPVSSTGLRQKMAAMTR